MVDEFTMIRDLWIHNKIFDNSVIHNGQEYGAGNTTVWLTLEVHFLELKRFSLGFFFL